MLDKKTFIEQLEDFQNTSKYTLKQFACFIKTSAYTKDFFDLHINLFRAYVKKYPRTIVKYSKDKPKNLHFSYTAEEMKIISDIEEKHLLAFVGAYAEFSEFDILKSHGTKMRLLIRSCLDDDDARKDFIDYIIKFCVCPYDEQKGKPQFKAAQEAKKIRLTYFEKTDSFTLDFQYFELAEHEKSALKEICRILIPQNCTFTSYSTVSRINKKAKKIIYQKLIKRKPDGGPYKLEDNISYRD